PRQSSSDREEESLASKSDKENAPPPRKPKPRESALRRSVDERLNVQRCRGPFAAGEFPRHGTPPGAKGPRHPHGTRAKRASRFSKRRRQLKRQLCNRSRLASADVLKTRGQKPGILPLRNASH